MLDFLGIGAQRSGTTWLHANLQTHPEIFLAEPKEVHFWDRRRRRAPWDLATVLRHRGRWVLRPTHGLGWYRELFARVPPGHAGGEITPAYAILNNKIISIIKKEFPQLKLIYSIRNPIDRSWSAALMALSRRNKPVATTPDAWFLRHFNSANSRRRSDYEACIRNWSRSYGRDRLLIILFDEIVGDPRRVLRRCASHLGLDPHPFDALSDAEAREAVNAGAGHPIRPQLRDYLCRVYRPKIESLAAYLDRDLSAWLQDQRDSSGSGHRSNPG